MKTGTILLIVSLLLVVVSWVGGIWTIRTVLGEDVSQDERTVAQLAGLGVGLTGLTAAVLAVLGGRIADRDPDITGRTRGKYRSASLFLTVVSLVSVVTVCWGMGASSAPGY